MQTMTSVTCRRNSMTLLSLYDLDKFTSFSPSSQTISTNSDYDREIQIPVQTKSLLEDLSNELLIDIFGYLSPYDLHRSVYNLNLHLNAICRVQKLRLDLGSSKRAFDYYCANQQPFASQIYSLKLDDNYERLTTFNQYINIDLFTNLRMLKVIEASPENLEKILSKLHTLSHLFYLNIRSTLIQSSSITVAIFSIRSLTHLILYSSDPIIFQLDPDQIVPFAELEYLEVEGCLATQFLELLKYVGSHIRRMRIRLVYDRHQNVVLINPTVIDEWLFNNRTLVSLRRVEMKFYFLSLTNFHLLLRLFPHLTYLTFLTLTDDIDFISPTIWHQFISTNLLELTRLQFHIEIRGLLGNVIQCPSTEVIDSFHSMNSQWLVDPVVMDYNSLLIKPVLELYTYSQSVRASKYSVELYGKKRYIATAIGDVALNIDRTITHLRITLKDDQQLMTTNDQLPLYEANGTYPKVTKIILHSQMTRSSTELDNKNSLIISDIIKSIPDLSKITSLRFSTDSSIYPPRTLARRLLDKMPKVNRLDLSYNYLLCLLKSPLIVQLLSKKVESLTIEFTSGAPLLPDMIRILKIFSFKLHFLYFDIRMDFPAKKFYFILPLLFGKLGKKLYNFQLRLSGGSQQQPQIFDEQFKLRLRKCLTAQLERNKAKSGKMEYGIKEKEFSISF